MRYILQCVYAGLSGFALGQTSSAQLVHGVMDVRSKPILPADASGNARRSSAYVPCAQTLDFALVRDFTVAERARCSVASPKQPLRAGKPS